MFNGSQLSVITKYRKVMYNFNYCVIYMPPGVSIDSAPFHMHISSNIPAVTFLSPFPMHHLVINVIPPGSHLTHIPDLQAESHKDNHQKGSLLLLFDKESLASDQQQLHLRDRLPPVPRSYSNNGGRSFCIELTEQLSSYYSKSND